MDIRHGSTALISCVQCSVQHQSLTEGARHCPAFRLIDFMRFSVEALDLLCNPMRFTALNSLCNWSLSVFPFAMAISLDDNWSFVVHGLISDIFFGRRFAAAFFGNNVQGHTTRVPPVGFELATNGIQFYAIANLDKTSLKRDTLL